MARPGPGADPVRPCDFCKEPVAPFGYAPPPSSGIPIRRPIWTCAATSCRDAAEARRADLIASRDPFKKTTAAPLRRDENQPSLF